MSIREAIRDAVGEYDGHGAVERIASLFALEDVQALRAIANNTLDRDPGEPFSNPVAADRVRHLADVIEALLRFKERNPRTARFTRDPRSRNCEPGS